MKKLFTFLCLMMATVALNAQNLLIHHKSGDVTKIALDDIEYVEVADDMTELVEVNIINLGRFSFDVEVKKSSKCVRYVVGAIKSTVYNESAFVEAAIQSLDEGQFYRPYEHSIGTESQVFAERQLGINSIENYDNDDKKPIYTTVMVYAIDAEGNGKVYTTEFLVPKGSMEATPTATVTATDASYSDFTITISADANCKKIIYGIATPEGLNGTPMSAAAMITDKMSQGLPMPYTGPITISAKDMLTVSPQSTYYPYVIPIAEDGKIGQVTYTTIKTPALTADGAGRILSASGTLQIEGQYQSVACPKMTFNDAARKVRIMWCAETDFNNYKNRLVEVFAMNRYAWSEYDVNDMPRALNVYQYATKYYMYAATVDSEGRVSEAQDVLAMMGIASPYTTNAMSSVVPAIDFDGTATATIVNDDKEIKYSPYDPTRVTETNPYFTVTAGANLSAVLVLRIDIDATDIVNEVESALVGYPNYLVGDGGARYELTYSNGTWSVHGDMQNLSTDPSAVRFKESWLNYEKLVFVTIDTNGRPKIHSYYNPNDGTLHIQ